MMRTHAQNDQEIVKGKIQSTNKSCRAQVNNGQFTYKVD